MDMKISMEMDMSEVRPQWQSITLSALHCGAGCTLADIIGEWFTYWVPLQIGGSLIAGSWALDFVLALILGVFFQFIAIREMEAISFREAVSRAFKADFFSLLAWQVGMYSWMAVATFILFKDESQKHGNLHHKPECPGCFFQRFIFKKYKSSNSHPAIHPYLPS